MPQTDSNPMPTDRERPTTKVAGRLTSSRHKATMPDEPTRGEGNHLEAEGEGGPEK